MNKQKKLDHVTPGLDGEAYFPLTHNLWCAESHAFINLHVDSTMYFVFT